jgi:hypothetical protein
VRWTPSTRASGEHCYRVLVDKIALRPLTFGEVLDTAFNLFKRNFKTAVAVSAVIMIPLALLGGAASAGLAPTDLAVLEDPDPAPEAVLGLMGGLLGAASIGALIQSFGSLLVQAATTRLYAESYRGGTLAMGDALRYGLRRLPAMLGLTIVSAVATFVGLILCIAPGVWLYTAWSAAPAALIAEDTRPLEALRRSFQLVKGNWWRTFGLLVVANILVSVIVALITTPLQFAIGLGVGMSDPTAPFSGGYLAANTIISGVITAATVPFLAAVIVAIYFDLRVRKEGYDLERLIADLGEPPGTSAWPDAAPPSDDPFGLG